MPDCPISAGIGDWSPLCSEVRRGMTTDLQFDAGVSSDKITARLIANGRYRSNALV
jgi:hypothetical protein